uniref:Uncharacterized protein n=1 Tax=Magnetococcus massalia (strain MO-1) TaxID=451514 RepID=A0A1S7LE48_MAGMO|nr:protein of unknown function [Candidatus Magnetococcus massalia]
MFNSTDQYSASYFGGKPFASRSWALTSVCQPLPLALSSSTKSASSRIVTGCFGLSTLGRPRLAFCSRYASTIPGCTSAAGRALAKSSSVHSGLSGSSTGSLTLNLSQFSSLPRANGTLLALDFTAFEAEVEAKAGFLLLLGLDVAIFEATLGNLLFEDTFFSVLDAIISLLSLIRFSQADNAYLIWLAACVNHGVEALPDHTQSAEPDLMIVLSIIYNDQSTFPVELFSNREINAMLGNIDYVLVVVPLVHAQRSTLPFLFTLIVHTFIKRSKIYIVCTIIHVREKHPTSGGLLVLPDIDHGVVLADLPEVMSRLHLQPACSTWRTKSLLKTHRKLSPYGRLTVADIRQGLAAYFQMFGSVLNGDIERLKDILVQDLPRMGRIIHAHGSTSLVVVLIINNLELIIIENAEDHTPVGLHDDTPDSLALTLELMQAVAWKIQLFNLAHAVQHQQDTTELLGVASLDTGLITSAVVFFQPFVNEALDHIALAAFTAKDNATFLVAASNLKLSTTGSGRRRGYPRRPPTPPGIRITYHGGSC